MPWRLLYESSPTPMYKEPAGSSPALTKQSSAVCLQQIPSKHPNAWVHGSSYAQSFNPLCVLHIDMLTNASMSYNSEVAQHSTIPARTRSQQHAQAAVAARLWLLLDLQSAAAEGVLEWA
jgi:hypothetical protein